ncbi:hypothetical protein [Lactiplantibacillus plantarum]|uniref:hypothetical protein n=1 Tax=Lactiplantibacillus plantarum TaxID=1590 RepID=UPI00265495FB|nr:hypothetical protein [Lactiplantibacillus plantarum]MDN7014428.1 hypothetical protein [Lactiplantibacillus plantarum]MDN7048051.1 hypothetical protein [Lactiplantibacillus plantarum]MDN7051134.1 hypothetical protein [Lactiplantibacillus plantarum]MDN7054137.1 hypothetical protein [Lactiplantibacillus plantarum]MDN7057211.1 hypothetical protein [Lactiplantibacillus plantarum]
MEQDKLATDELTNLPLDHNWYVKLADNFTIIQGYLQKYDGIIEELATINNDVDSRLSAQNQTQAELLKEQADSLQDRINRIIMGTDTDAIIEVLQNIGVCNKSGTSLTSRTYPFKAIASSFSGQNYTSLDLYWTSDYEKFYPINKSVIKGLEGEEIRDPSITYFGGKYLVADTSWKVYYSTDLTKFDSVPISNIPDTSINWAPEWVVDGNDLYLFACGGNNNTYDVNADMRIYYTRFDADTMSFGTWNQLTYDVPTGVRANIDPTVAKYNGEWYMAMKLEYGLGTNGYLPRIQLYKSNSATGYYSYVMDLPFQTENNHFDLQVEGPSLCVDGDKLYCFADGFSNTTSYRLETTDGKDWSHLIDIGASDGSRMQHFTVYPLQSQNEQQIIQDATMYYLPEAMGNGISNYRLTLPEQFLQAGVNELYPQPGIEMYYHIGSNVPNGSLVEVNLHMDRNRNYSKIRFVIENNSTDIRLKLNKTAAFIPPYGLDSYETNVSDTPLVLVAKGSSDWKNNLSEPYRIESNPVSRVGGRNYALATQSPSTLIGKGNVSGQTIAAYQLSKHADSRLVAQTHIRISADLTFTKPDNGSIFVGFNGGGSWIYRALDIPMINGTKHISFSMQLTRQLTSADKLIFSVDNTFATIRVENVMLETGDIEHDSVPAPEDYFK